MVIIKKARDRGRGVAVEPAIMGTNWKEWHATVRFGDCTKINTQTLSLTGPRPGRLLRGEEKR